MTAFNLFTEKKLHNQSHKRRIPGKRFAYARCGNLIGQLRSFKVRALERFAPMCMTFQIRRDAPVVIAGNRCNQADANRGAMFADRRERGFGQGFERWVRQVGHGRGGVRRKGKARLI